MHEGINWAIWIGIVVSGLLGASSLVYNIYRDRVRVTIVSEIDGVPLYTRDEQGQRVYAKHDFPVYRAIVTNTGLLGVNIQAVEVRAVDSQQRYPLKKEGSDPSKKLVDGDFEVWSEDLIGVGHTFHDVPFHASTYVVATDTAGREYRSRNWTTIRTYRPNEEN